MIILPESMYCMIPDNTNVKFFGTILPGSALRTSKNKSCWPFKNICYNRRSKWNIHHCIRKQCLVNQYKFLSASKIKYMADPPPGTSITGLVLCCHHYSWEGSFKMPEERKMFSSAAIKVDLLKARIRLRTNQKDGIKRTCVKLVISARQISKNNLCETRKQELLKSRFYLKKNRIWAGKLNLCNWSYKLPQIENNNFIFQSFFQGYANWSDKNWSSSKSSFFKVTGLPTSHSRTASK